MTCTKGNEAAFAAMAKRIDILERRLERAERTLAQHAGIFNNHQHYGTVDAPDGEYASRSSVHTGEPIRGGTAYGGGGTAVTMDNLVVMNEDVEELPSHLDLPVPVLEIEGDKANPPLNQILAFLRHECVLFDEPEEWPGLRSSAQHQRLVEAGADKYVNVCQDTLFLVFNRDNVLVAVEYPNTGKILAVKTKDQVGYVNKLAMWHGLDDTDDDAVDKRRCYREEHLADVAKSPQPITKAKPAKKKKKKKRETEAYLMSLLRTVDPNDD